VDVQTLTVDEAIAQRQQLHKKKLRVRGVLTLRFEHSGLRSLGESKVSDRDGRTELWIRFPSLRKEDAKAFAKEYHQAYVEVFGTFNADDHGHMSGFAATISSIEITKLPPPTTGHGDPAK
jgi:hypothetical protein